MIRRYMDSAKGKYGYVVAAFTTSQTEYEDVIIWSDKYTHSPYTIDEIYVDGVKRDVVQKQRMYGSGDHEVVYFPKQGMDILGQYTFYACPKITKIDLTNYKQYFTIDASYMFGELPLLKEIIGLDNIHEVNNMDACFMGCSIIESIDLSSWNAKGCRSMANLFQNCFYLKYVKLPYYTEMLSNMRSIFYRCESLKSIDLSVLNTKLVEYMDNAFNQCTALNELRLTTDFSSVRSITYMCNKCTNLKTIDLSGFGLGNIFDAQYAFDGCGASSIDMLDIKIPTYVNGMFANMKSLTSLKMAGDPSSAISIQSMFDSTATGGTFYYNDAYDYSKIISKLPYNWKSQAI